MDLIVWSTVYSVSVEIIDEQHQRLMEMVNRLHRAQESNQGDDVTLRILDDLIEYTVYHFKTEEEMFEKSAYPNRERHISHHKALVGEVSKKVNDFKGNKEGIREQIMVFLTDWLKDHILAEDKEF
ncbi:MAG: hemerythrin family protein [Oligoflexia bacterium]|nr:hemerythrin family protein [Oligoflexia bacterium]